MDYVNPHALVSTEWLADHLNDDDLVIVDASFLFLAAPPLQKNNTRRVT